MSRRYRSKGEEGSKVPAYIVTYSDMVTLLLTFFVMLMSLAQFQDPELYHKLKKTGIVKGFDEQKLHDSELLDRSEQCAIIRHHES